MHQFSLNTYLELDVGRVVERQGKRLHVYFASRALDDGSTMNFTVSKNVDRTSETSPHVHHTQAQVLGDADLVGSTMFVYNASIIETDAPADAVQRLPAVVFAGDVCLFDHVVFDVRIDIGGDWPHPLRALCKVDWSSPHIVEDFILPVGARVSVSGLITGRRRDDVCITVHDVRHDGSSPCPGHCVQDVPALSGVVGDTFCQWFARQDLADVHARVSTPVAGNSTPRDTPSSPNAPEPASPRYASSSPYRPSAQDTSVAPRSPLGWDSEPSPRPAAQAGVAPRSPLGWDSEPSPRPAAQAGVAPRSPLGWDSEPSPRPTAQAGVAPRSPLGWDSEPSPRPAAQAGVAPRSPLGWDSEPSPQPISTRQFSQTQAPAHRDDHRNDHSSSQVGGAVQAAVARRSPLSWDSEPSPQLDSTREYPQTQAVALDGATPSPQDADPSEGARDQVRLPPSPGPHKRSYWQWSDLRVESSPF